MGFLIEPAAARVGVLLGCDFELPALLRRRDVDARGGQPIQMLSPVLGRKHVKGAVSATDAFADEGQQRAIFIIRRVEEGADVPVLAQHRTRERNRRWK